MDLTRAALQLTPSKATTRAVSITNDRIVVCKKSEMRRNYRGENQQQSEPREAVQGKGGGGGSGERIRLATIDKESSDWKARKKMGSVLPYKLPQAEAVTTGYERACVINARVR